MWIFEVTSGKFKARRTAVKCCTLTHDLHSESRPTYLWLFNDTVASYYTTPSIFRMAGESWIGNYIEGSGRGLFQDTIPALVWGKPQKYKPGYPVRAIRNRDLPNTKHEWQWTTTFGLPDLNCINNVRFVEQKTTHQDSRHDGSCLELLVLLFGDTVFKYCVFCRIFPRFSMRYLQFTGVYSAHHGNSPKSAVILSDFPPTSRDTPLLFHPPTTAPQYSVSPTFKLF